MYSQNENSIEFSGLSYCLIIKVLYCLSRSSLIILTQGVLNVKHFFQFFQISFFRNFLECCSPHLRQLR